ncbi:ATP-binding protein [Thermus filiformis]|uniref:histidine kinase n=1 Tax=Thermus filiformis TaxID=276 RepID=A0A0A2WRX0_THEFI|nr:ATP-binding protein [Thermus filiformis]KGQ22553.2 histidine kinase [Thermus filiformis]
MRLGVQLLLTVLLAATATGGLFLLGGGAFLLAEGEKALWQQARAGARDLATLLTDDLLLQDRLAMREKLQGARDRYPGLAYAYVLGPGGGVLAHTFPEGVPEALLALSGERAFRLEGQVVYQAEAPVYGGQAGLVRLGLYQAPLWEEVGKVVRTGLFGLLWAVGLGVGVGYLLLQRVLEPLNAMAERVARLGRGEEVRFPEPRNELGVLGRALNRMGEEVERRERELTLLNRLLAQSQALRLEELAERVLSLLVRELGFACGDLWVDGRVVHCRACRAFCPLGGVDAWAEEALREGRVVVRAEGVAVPVPPRGALVLHGRPQVEEAWLVGLLTALSGPLAAALENARLYGLLEEKERQRAGLLKAWLRAQEEERGRIARELHDEVGQALTGLILGLEALPDDRARALKELARYTLAEVRRLALDLRPSVLDHLGLEAALERYVREFSARTGIAVDLSYHLTRPLSRELETVVYRVVQEALTNVARHSGSPRAAVGVLEAEGEVRVFVEDEGRGFDPQGVGPGHQGLWGMRERVELSGGRLVVESAPGEGTRVQARLPLEVAA